MSAGPEILDSLALSIKRSPGERDGAYKDCMCLTVREPY